MELELTNRKVDPTEEGFNFVIRLGPLGDSSLIAKDLGALHFVLCASPRYLKRCRPIDHPSDLESHSIIDFFGGAERHVWTFLRNNETVKVEVKPRMDATTRWYAATQPLRDWGSCSYPYGSLGLRSGRSG